MLVCSSSGILAPGLPVHSLEPARLPEPFCSLTYSSSLLASELDLYTVYGREKHAKQNKAGEAEEEEEEEKEEDGLLTLEKRRGEKTRK